MRVRLKGINTVRKKLADGRVASYWYAWKGGPRLPGMPGSAEFIHAYNEAVALRRAGPSGTLQSILNAYQASADFTNLADRTRRDYVRQIRRIETEFGEFPLSALVDRRAREEFLSWRDRLAVTSRRQADYAFSVLALVLAWAKDRGKVVVNPCERAGRIYRGTRAEKVWSDSDEEAFYRSAPSHLHLPLLMALCTGQRQGDLLRLTWFNYDGDYLRLQQSKTGRRVTVPVVARLKQAFVDIGERGERILLNSDGRPWTSGGFSASFRKACKRAGISGLTFHDTRGTAVTRLAIEGATVPEIATFTGHSLRDVHMILESHYLNRDPALAQQAARKLEGRTKIPN